MKAIKCIALAVVIATIAYNSLYFKKLNEVRASLSAQEFNAPVYARNFWNNKLMPALDHAIDLGRLRALLSADAPKTMDSYSHALGIGNLRYFLVKGMGTVKSVNEDDISILLAGDSSKQRITLDTEYIFGNAVRDATGLININEFNNTMDFNDVSAELNKIVREKVLPSFKEHVKDGNTIEFTGAIELNKEHLDLSNIEMIPVKVAITNQ